MLICTDTCGNMVKDGSSDYSLCVRYRGELLGRLGREGYGIGKGNEDQSQSNKAPAVVADVIRFEIIGREVPLGRWAKP